MENIVVELTPCRVYSFSFSLKSMFDFMMHFSMGFFREESSENCKCSLVRHSFIFTTHQVLSFFLSFCVSI